MLYSIRDLVKDRQAGQAYRLFIRKLDIPEGACIALTGPSGCGKSTTLDLLGLSLKPDSAKRFVFSPLSSGTRPDIAIMELWARNRLDDLASLRLQNMGYVLQSGELLPYLNTGENMLLTAALAGIPKSEALKKARQLAEQLGIIHLWNNAPATLSVGERQRAAIVRALTPSPAIILADEPTAALDPLRADHVMEAFLAAVNQAGSTLVLVTHNADWARRGGLRQLVFTLEENSRGVTATLDDGETP